MMNSHQRRKMLRTFERHVQREIFNLLTATPPWMPVEGAPYLMRMSGEENRAERVSPRIEFKEIPRTIKFKLEPGDIDRVCESLRIPNLSLRRRKQQKGAHAEA